jgi:hypothetical protein
MARILKRKLYWYPFWLRNFGNKIAKNLKIFGEIDQSKSQGVIYQI